MTAPSPVLVPDTRPVPAPALTATLAAAPLGTSGSTSAGASTGATPPFRVGEEVAALLEALLAEATPARAAAAFCSRLAVGLGARRVCLGVLVPGRAGRADAREGPVPARRARVIAESFRPRPELPAEQLRALDAVMLEACDQQVMVDSAARAPDGPIARCAETLANQNQSRVLAVPLGEAGQVYGALVIELPRVAVGPGAGFTPPGPQQLEALFARIGPLTARLLSLIEVRGPWARWWARVAGPASFAAGPIRPVDPRGDPQGDPHGVPAGVPAGVLPGVPRGDQQDDPLTGPGARYLGGLLGRVGSTAAARLADPQQALRRRLLVSGASLLAGIVCWPWPHSISAPARLEGEIQRVVAVPADGYLKEVLVRPGDRVRAGQLLGALGERELDLDRGRLSSDLAQRRGEKAVALAKGDRAAMMIAQSRMDEAQAQLDLIEQQSQRYLLTAPIDGVVIEGDWVRSVGAPLERGKTLFTVAPVDRYRVIVELDERDINQVREGQPGRLALSALPSEVIHLKVARVGASAAVVDGRNVFELEADPIDAPALGLRPGLKGVARLEDAPRALVAVWWRRLAHSLRAQWWRWWP